MRTFEKNYIGKGRKVDNLEIVTVTLKMEEAEKHIFEYEGQKYLKFEVAALQNADKYGRTHTAYISKLVDAVDEGDMATLPESTPEPPKKQGSKKKASAKAKKDEDLPF